ncbi:hypothetical protein [Bacillus sp. FJAT-27445]|uniref:hypothetical protein n=1 Tax=Bacillus sp. FJAT-27445 TaxID=1679166 RepID=UPI000AF9860A|nr:hypothetical protein [Bacillus sp. FJAT-27445]
MKSRILLIVMAIFFFTGTMGAMPGMAKSYTSYQLVRISEGYARELSPLINRSPRMGSIFSMDPALSCKPAQVTVKI